VRGHRSCIDRIERALEAWTRALPLTTTTASRYAAVVSATPRKKVTFYLDEDVLRAARVRAARSDRRDSEIVEEALRAYLGFDVVERVWARSDLNEDEALELALSEVHAMRDEKSAARRP
jgi:hypothetical protein